LRFVGDNLAERGGFRGETRPNSPHAALVKRLLPGGSEVKPRIKPIEGVNNLPSRTPPAAGEFALVPAMLGWAWNKKKQT
jgi:hypothetical protein